MPKLTSEEIKKRDEMMAQYPPGKIAKIKGRPSRNMIRKMAYIPGMTDEEEEEAIAAMLKALDEEEEPEHEE